MGCADGWHYRSRQEARSSLWRIERVDKTPLDEPSPFVRMVRALQALFPEASRHYQSTYVATTEAIAVARRRYRERKTNLSDPAP